MLSSGVYLTGEVSPSHCHGGCGDIEDEEDVLIEVHVEVEEILHPRCLSFSHLHMHHTGRVLRGELSYDHRSPHYNKHDQTRTVSKEDRGKGGGG